jgi:peptidoglycan/xylan/chitin deacetylase (PgdA/CDA1 family)
VRASALWWAIRALRSLTGRSTAVLAYHGIADIPASVDPHRLMTSPKVIHAQVDALGAAGIEFVTVSELGRRTEGATPPRGLVALTFDDAHRNLLEPLLGLAERGVPTTVYAVVNWIDRRHPRFMDRNGEILSRAQLVELADHGVEIGCHTMTHPDLSELPFSRCLAELRDGREALEDIVGRPVTTAAYPYGRFSEDSVRAARESGFQLALAMEEGRGWEPLAMSRAGIGRGESWPAFVLKATGQWPRFSESGAGRLSRATVNRLRRRAS